MPTLILLRHGESQWNRDNLITGWTDVGLSEHGMAQARLAGQLIQKCGPQVDVAFTSFLKRAIRTLWLSLEEMGRMWISEHKSWRLNERHYGALQGLNKSQTAADSRYAQDPACTAPLTESLKDTYERVIPYWESEILPQMQADKIGETEIAELNIAIGEPLAYEMDTHLNPMGHRYLNSAEAIAKGVERQMEMGKATTAQGKS